MARGRHRNAPLHRVLVPAALGGSALLCASAAWLVGASSNGGEVMPLRGLVAVTAAPAVAGAILLRRWDLAAGRRVARERAGKASMSWRLEERQAELEEARELAASLEEHAQRAGAELGQLRSELGRLRSEHAALLRRYATAESERAAALEGRRQLALEAAKPARAIPAQSTDHRAAGGAPTPLTYHQAYEALSRLSLNGARQQAEQLASDQWEEPADRAASATPPRPAPTAPAAPAPRHADGFDFFGTGASSPRCHTTPGRSARDNAADESDRAAV